MAIQPFVHKDPKATDDTLNAEADEYAGKTVPIQVTTELLMTLREIDVPWWSPEKRRSALSAGDRMKSLTQRPDIRQRIMTELCGLPPKAARRMGIDSQSELIDDVLLEDKSIHEFENAFKPAELVIYGNAAALFYQFMDAMPFDKDTDPHRTLIAAIIESCLSDKREHDKKKLSPVLTYHDVRTAIDYDVWQDRIPRELRVAVDKARLEQEKAKPRDPFTARAEIDIVTVSNITKHIPLKQLAPILEAAAKKMGFDRPTTSKTEEDLDLEADDASKKGTPSPKS